MTPEPPSPAPSSPRAQHSDRNVRLDPQGIYGTRSARRQNQLRRRRQFQNALLWSIGALATLALGRWALQPRHSLRPAREVAALPFHPASEVLAGPSRLFFTSQSGGLWRAVIGADGALGAPQKLWSTAFAPGATPLVTPTQIFWPGGDGTLAALDGTSGRPKWSANLPSALVATPALARVGNRGILLAGDDAGNLAAFDSQSGVSLWKLALGGAIGSGIAVLEAPPSASTAPNLASTASFQASTDPIQVRNEAMQVSTDPIQVRNGPFQVANERLQVTNERFQVANARFQVANARFQVANAANQAAPGTSEAARGTRGASTTPTEGAGFLVPLLAGPGSAGGLVCLDAQTGAQRWRFSGDSRSPSGGIARPLAQGNRVFWCNDEGAVVCLDGASGRKIWKSFAAPLDPRSDDLVMLRAAPTVAAGVLVVGGEDGAIRAFDLRTGAARWTRELGGPVRFGAQSLGFEGKSALLVTGEVAGLWVLDARSGAVLRRWSTPHPNSCGAALVAKNAYALDADGHLQIAALD